MALEIERKFLVRGDGWRSRVTGRHQISQAYLSRHDKASVRVRIVDDRSATLTIKSHGVALSRLEFEYPVPVSDARVLMDLRQGGIVTKVRYLVPHDGFLWEIDVFAGDNAGLVVAEIELPHASQTFSLPSWLGREVTQDARFANSNLARFPVGGHAEQLEFASFAS
jgi:adenylate cyclase